MCVIRSKSLVIIIALFVLFQVSGFSQELKCNIQVSSDKIEGMNKKIFDTMKQSLMEFMNSQKWSDNVFADNERIECNFVINITTAVSANEFEGTIRIQASRPVYGSSYSTVLFNRLDDNFQFKYTEFQSFSYNPNSFDSNLVGVLAYYANMILGYDYDSFSSLGGTAYFLKAQQIVSRAQGATESGWKAFDNKRNRYWVVDDVLNEQLKPLRLSFYKYHRLGLDNMATKSSQARGEVTDALEQLRKVARAKPMALAMQIFFDAKSQEIISIYSEANQAEKTKVLDILKEIDPINSVKYEAAIKSAN